MKTVYVENNDGVFSAYTKKSDPMVVGKLVECNLPESIADTLIQITKDYNESQDLMRQLYNGEE